MTVGEKIPCRVYGEEGIETVMGKIVEVVGERVAAQLTIGIFGKLKRRSRTIVKLGEEERIGEFKLINGQWHLMCWRRKK